MTICNLYPMTTTTEASQRLLHEWQNAMHNISPLYAIKQRGDGRVLGLHGGDSRH